MPCLLGCLALSTPRLVLLLVFLFSDYLARAYETNFWPFLGFFFLPLTTLAYAGAMNENHGEVSGLWLVIVILAVAIDLGLIRLGSYGRQRAGPGPRSGGGPAIEVRGERVR